MFVKILAPDNLKAVVVDELIGIKESTLSAVLLRAEWRCSKVNDLFKYLPVTQETLAEFYNVNPIKVTPSGISFFLSV